MKSLILVAIVASLLGVAHSQSSGAKATDVISKFREIAPRYLELVKYGEGELEMVRGQATDAIAKFHDDIIRIKETYVLDAIQKQDYMHFQIVNQPPSVDNLCLSFLNTTLDMSINLAGVGFTNCINNVDDSFGTMVSEYYSAIGVRETLLNELRLLDVFRGDNVFYSPQNIIDKLDKKMAGLNIRPDTVNAELEKMKEVLQQGLEDIRSKYVGCMTQSEQLLKNGVDLMMMQLAFSCLGQVVEEQ